MRNAIFDRTALAAGLFVYLTYAVMDAMVLDYVMQAILIRAAGVSTCLAVLCLVQLGRISVRLDRLIPIMVVFLGSLINMVIFIEPSIENNYFIGLIQIAVFISFMLRAGFVSSNAALLFLLAGYLAAISGKTASGTQMLASQIYFLVMMFGSCSAGIYILERYRRTLFLNSRIIDEQNALLEKMVEELKQTVSRKTALLKVFTHVMKTPVHQMVGFLQVVRHELEESKQPAIKSESMSYAEAAAAGLRKIVEEMVDYHFVDNYADDGVKEEIEISEIFEEFFFEEIEQGGVRLSGARSMASVDRQLLMLAMKHLRAYYGAGKAELQEIRINQKIDGTTIIELVDAAPRLSAVQFQALTCQLTSIENYLSGEGANPEMTLRTAARALERLGAEFKVLDGGDCGLQIRLPSRIQEAA